MTGDIGDTGDTGATGGTTDSYWWSHERQDEMTDTGATKDRYWSHHHHHHRSDDRYSMICRSWLQYDLSLVVPVFVVRGSSGSSSMISSCSNHSLLVAT